MATVQCFFSLQARLISLPRLIGGIMGNEFTGSVLIGFNQRRQRNLNTKHEKDAFALTLIFKFLLRLAELLLKVKKETKQENVVLSAETSPEMHVWMLCVWIPLRERRH